VVVLAVLADPVSFRPLGQAARAAVEAQFGLDVAVPALQAFFDELSRPRTALETTRPTLRVKEPAGPGR
jgi:hypothetical protein